MRRSGWVLVLCALLLSGCVAPPSSGPVQAGLTAPVPGTVDPLVRPIANPPRPDMTPVEVVSGFLDAAAAVGEDFQVAREYLTGEAAAQWNPGAGVTVMASNPASLAQAPTGVAASFTQVGTVSAAGVYTQQAPTPAALTFPMASVAGQWRIAQAPDGLLLSAAELDRGFETRYTYFIDPSETIAVPDVRVVPRTDQQALSTALVISLLAGPSDWLAPAVRSEIPDGLQLALGAVPVVDGVARVELSGPSISLDADAAQGFGAQLGWTLRQVPGVQAMDVLLNGRPLQLADRRGPIMLTTYDSFNPDVISGSVPLYGVDDAGSLAIVVDDQVQPLIPPAPIGGIAVGPRREVWAAATNDRRSVLIGRLATPDSPPQSLASDVVGSPRIDALGRVWWVTGDGSIQMAQADESGTYGSRDVQVAHSPGRIRQVRPARDGTRIAVLVGDGSSARSYLGVVVVGTDEAQIDGLRPLGDPAVSDVAWHDSRQLTVIDSQDEVIRRTDLLGSANSTFAIPSDVVAVTDAPAGPVVLGMADAAAGRLTGNGVRVVAGLHAPAYPG